ncbi:winged helix-turn-helix domain-containing tetratricopeptide repeat protein [Devosia nitrariae]|uniref:winged helix-turn-helix domain-containing tetratricopeptide repeat protein n=1 Tax=Devosia nitrariae TaxID=2071872 RepID=UPI0024E16048|nr:winged helix-turn-helix domain-containing protein [Devosia nitrariae]
MAVALGHRGSGLLRVLTAKRGEIISKDALLQAAWPGQVVEESNLSVQIAALRKALGTSPAGQEWIATVPRIGYRFLGPGNASRTDNATPVIAVLPFDNVSSDREQEFFAQGLAEDLITDLSRVPGLVVIARNSSFAMRERRGDTRGIGADLGARFIIDGSVRRSSNKVRINVQLIEVAEQAQLWAERFDGDLSDVFTLQDQVVGRVVGALSRVLAVGDAPRNRRPVDIGAYDAFQRGRSIFLRSPEGYREGVALFHKAIQLDPDFAEPHAWLAMSHVQSGLHWGVEPRQSIENAVTEAEAAIGLDPDNGDALAHLGYALAFTPRLGEAGAAFARALNINPNHADAMALKAELLVIEGRPGDGVDLVRSAMRLNPYPPSWYDWMLAFAYYAGGRYEDVVATLNISGVERAPSGRLLAAALAQLGLTDEARAAAAAFLRLMPGFSIQRWLTTQNLQRQQDADRFAEGYRKAGLPE